MRKPLVWLLSLVLILAGFGAAAAWGILRGSLPRLDGEHRPAAVESAVRIERDANGVATIFASSRTDLFFAQGFVHAQERFFQMDLSRRLAAGRLAELFGQAAIDVDRRARVHGLRLVADDVVAGLSAHHRAQLNAYVAGVNEGVAALSTKPFEYWLLGAQPEPWIARDSVLVQLAMFLDLTDEEAQLDQQRGVMFERLPGDVYRWLTAPGTTWDAPLEGGPVDLPPLPGERWYPLDTQPVTTSRGAAEDARGSNSFAVAGALSGHGGATLANDMHLGLRVPNTWYRLRLIEGSAATPAMQAVGVSLPGTPGIVVGSNTRIAWGFTNSYGDWSDRIVLRSPAADIQQVRDEIIEVKDEAAVTVSVSMTRFGPVLAQDDGPPVAVRWLGHHPEAVNLNLLDMVDVTDVDGALALAHRLGIPPQNFLVAGDDGRVAWTIAGRIPKRVGYDPSRPLSGDEAGGWRGWLQPDRYPVVLDPSSGRLWTANARVASLVEAPIIGLSDYPLGARAGRIRDLLFARERFNESQLLTIALDTRGVFLERWRTLMRSVLTPKAVAGNEGRRALLAQLSGGPLEATIDAVDYPLVRAFRARVEQDLIGAFLQPLGDEFRPRIDLLRQREGPLWQTVSERPDHLLPPGDTSWDGYFLGVMDGLSARFAPDAPGSSWGAYNTSRIRHPLSGALPVWLGRWLDMPARPLPGDAWMPRVQGPTFGASQRLVVSPGREEDGLFHMPAGQSGHPLSPFYRRAHADWEAGNATALLPGPTRYTLVLQPAVEE